jgi:Xaa-Pro aminopeptidase
MFKAEVYSDRRDRLRSYLSGGLALFPANNESPVNYPDNTYHYRQDSSFLYFFGLDQPALTGVIDIDSGEDCLFGDDLSLDDIIWMGHLPSMRSLGEKAGISRVRPRADLPGYLEEARQKGRDIHYLPPYRDDTLLEIATLINKPWEEIKTGASLPLTRE